MRHTDLQPRRPARATFLFVALMLALPFLASGDALGGRGFDRQLRAVVRPYAFSIFQWEVATLAAKLQERVGQIVSPRRLSAQEQDQLVPKYLALGVRWQELQTEKQKLYATAKGQPDPAQLGPLDAEIGTLEAQRQAMAGAVERALGGQVSQTLHEMGIRDRLVNVSRLPQFPFVSVAITPDVFFKFERLPLLLVVAPRDRIAVRTSLFVQPHLTLEQMQQVEGRVDDLDVSSIAVPLGGFAAYPSMIPDGDPLQRTLTVIAHEWAHHYLALRPLGFRYFSSYEMRSINETVADMVGNEVGAEVYRRYYQSEDIPPVPPASPRTGPARPDFGQRMRAIRKEVEAYLARADVPGAERYMEEQRQQLVAEGWYVRKLNTAYLSFFGAYSGGGNAFEDKLTQLRRASPSLRAFLATVEGIGSRRDFDRLVVPGA